MKTLTAISEQIYGHYHGDSTRAIVRDGTCVRSTEVGQTGAVWRSNNPGADPWRGATVDELKAAGFAYRFTNTVYTDANGTEYYLADDGSYRSDDPEIDAELSADEVTVVQQ